MTQSLVLFRCKVCGCSAPTHSSYVCAVRNPAARYAKGWVTHDDLCWRPGPPLKLRKSGPQTSEGHFGHTHHCWVANCCKWVGYACRGLLHLACLEGKNGVRGSGLSETPKDLWRSTTVLMTAMRTCSLFHVSVALPLQHHIVRGPSVTVDMHAGLSVQLWSVTNLTPTALLSTTDNFCC